MGIFDGFCADNCSSVILAPTADDKDIAFFLAFFLVTEVAGMSDCVATDDDKSNDVDAFIFASSLCRDAQGTSLSKVRAVAAFEPMGSFLVAGTFLLESEQSSISITAFSLVGSTVGAVRRNGDAAARWSRAQVWAMRVPAMLLVLVG